MLGLFGEKGEESLHDLGSNVFIKEVNVWDFFRVKASGTRPLNLCWYMTQEGKMDCVQDTDLPWCEGFASLLFQHLCLPLNLIYRDAASRPVPLNLVLLVLVGLSP